MSTFTPKPVEFKFGEYFMDLNLIKHIKEKEESAAYTSTSNTEVMT